MRIWWISGLFIGLSLALANVAAACSCADPGPPCKALSQASAVFAGSVTAIEEAKSGSGEFVLYGRRIRFQVAESFQGLSGTAVDVYTGYGGGDCGYGFHKGGSYLVYAYRDANTGQLTTGICSRTQSLNNATHDLGYLRRRNDPGLGSGIEGYAFRLKRDSKGNTSWESYATGVNLLAERDGKTWEVTTGKGGVFSLWGLAPGKYRLRGQEQERYIVSASPEELEVPAKGCASAIVMLTPKLR